MDDTLTIAGVELGSRLFVGSSGYPSLDAFERAIERTAAVARDLLDTLVTTAEPRNREVEAARARERAAVRFGAR